MKNRLSKMSRTAYFMLLLLAAGGVSTSCTDEYKLDDEKPSWLSTSIYEGLQEDGHYTHYLRLLGDPDVQPQGEDARPLTEVLSRTGSKTVFVANDDAWEAFFKANAQLPESNPWHTATSYENLSVSQKKLLIHTSMLNNAIVMENLSSSSQDISSRGDYLRRYTDVETTDSITYVDGNSIPVNYNVGNDEHDYWWRFRTKNGGNGIYLVTDSSLSMMVHFTNEYLTRNNVSDQDFSIFMGTPRNTSDVHIYDAKLIAKDSVAENGYINKTEKVLTPLPNMAELIRTSGKTYIFSHMLDRWSVPFYNNRVTEAYKAIMKSRGVEWEDSIFTKRYFSDLSFGHRALNTDPNGQQFRDAASTDVTLKFDPGWNGFYASQSSAQYDMGAMFVPDDKTLWDYFNQGGGGWQLIRTYFLKEGTPNEIKNYKERLDFENPEDWDSLYYRIDQIPLSTLRSLINVIMFPSFVGSVPSKMTKLRDDAQEQIFFADDIEHIKGTMLANNGMVYLTDKVYGPADYTSVAAPAYISNTNLVMRWAIYNGSTSATDYMGLNYYAYLKAMQSQFVLFLPSDEALQFYFDPVSFKSTKGRMLEFYYRNASFPVQYNMYAYNSQTGVVGQLYNLERMTNGEITNRLKDILESHTIVLDGLDEINSDVNEYYLTKNGSGVKVTRENGRVVKVQGGFQLENEQRGIEGSSTNAAFAGKDIRGVQKNVVTDEQTMSNGSTYILDSPIVPASASVYSTLTNDGMFDNADYSAFYDLCEVNEDIVRACGLVDESRLSVTQQRAELKKYQIFVSDNGPDYNVQFFNNYNYTIFVPTAQRIQEAIAKGLPTWEDIEADYEACERKGELDEEGNPNANPEALKFAEDSLRLQTKITYLINFVRYHFADNSVFVDQSTFPSTDYVTASYDNVKGLFCKLNLQRPSAGKLQVQDNNGAGSPWIDVTGKYNVMTRDVSCSATPAGKNTMNGITIDGSSFAVIHQIDGVLNHTELTGDRYDATWATPSEAKKYLKRFAIH